MTCFNHRFRILSRWAPLQCSGISAHYIEWKGKAWTQTANLFRDEHLTSQLKSKLCSQEVQMCLMQISVLTHQLPLPAIQVPG